MPWEGVTVSEQKQRSIEDCQLDYYSVTELAERFSISRKTAHTHPGHQGKWIHRYRERGLQRLEVLSRRPKECLNQTEGAVVQELGPGGLPAFPVRQQLLEFGSPVTILGQPSYTLSLESS